MSPKFACIALLITLLTGCAGIDVARVTPENATQDGVRFYRPQPYLWITRDKDGNLVGSIMWLPNTKEEYLIQWHSGLGSSDLKFKLTDGWNLTDFGAVNDSQVPETIEALTGSLKDVAGTFKLPRGEELHPGLYVFIFDKDTGLISEIRPVSPSKEARP